MRHSEQIILSALERGACLKTFYRTSARMVGIAARSIPDGYVLESSDDLYEVILSYSNFQSVEKRLTKTETWEQSVGSTLFGGSIWTLRPDIDND